MGTLLDLLVLILDSLHQIGLSLHLPRTLEVLLVLELHIELLLQLHQSLRVLQVPALLLQQLVLQPVHSHLQLPVLFRQLLRWLEEDCVLFRVVQDQPRTFEVQLQMPSRGRVGLRLDGLSVEGFDAAGVGEGGFLAGGFEESSGAEGFGWLCD